MRPALKFELYAWGIESLWFLLTVVNDWMSLRYDLNDKHLSSSARVSERQI